MAKLTWDDVGKRLYETGVSQGVLYPMGDIGTYQTGVAWNGLSAVTQSPSGAEPTPIYADNIKYLNLMSAEEFGATVEAYTYPDEFAECDGSVSVAKGVYISGQPRKQFGLSYKTLVGNDVKGSAFGYKLHLVWGALAKPSERNYATVNDSPEAMTLSWELSTTPVAVAGHSPVAHMEIDSTKTSPEKMAALESKLYGGEGEPTLPSPSEVITMMAEVV